MSNSECLKESSQATTNAGGTDEFSTVANTSIESARASEALLAARQHVSIVQQELALLTENFGGAGGPKNIQHLQQQTAAASATIAAHDPGATDVGREGSASFPAEARIRLMEVDLSSSKDRAARLEADNKALMDAQAALEAQMRRTRQTLEETQRRLKHSELDLRKLRGLPPPITQTEEAEAQDSTGDAEGPLLHKLRSPALNKLAQLGPVGIGKPSASQPKQQLLAALSAAQAQLKQERERRDKVEKKAKQDADRLQRLVRLAEKQRDELVAQKQHSTTVEEYAAECERRLKHCFARSSSLHAAFNGVDELHEDGSPPFGAGSSGKTMSRNQSAPTLQQQPGMKLPSVAAGRPASRGTQ